jgi:hypothetical protein
MHHHHHLGTAYSVPGYSVVLLLYSVKYRVLHDTSLYSDGTVQGTVPGTQDEWAKGEKKQKNNNE